MPLLAVLALLFASTAGAAVVKLPSSRGPVFDFSTDTFAYVNELSWTYVKDPVTGATQRSENEQKPEYHLHCFAMSRMARQFFDYALFEPKKRKLDDKAYRAAVDAIIRRTPEQAEKEGKIVIPGYANLRSFSKAKEDMLKDASGSALKSYFQVSNMRMVFPFSRSHQADTAKTLITELASHDLPVIHLIRFSPFPVTLIDHAVLVIGAEEGSKRTRFRIYDPNNAERPIYLTYENDDRTFTLADTNYFTDGEVDVYEIYGNELK